MDPKTKAKELYHKYEFVYIQNYTSSHEVKQCALLAVDEIIKALEITTGHCELRKLDWHEVQFDFQYWNDVKQQIENLRP